MNILELVNVALSTFNGERYLIPQIESILNQVGVNVNIYVRDDNSNDTTIDLLTERKSSFRSLELGKKNIGAIQSFSKILNEIPNGNYLAFSDQDDIWLPEKLVRAVELLRDYETPAMYCSNVWIGDQKARNTSRITSLPLPRLPLNFFQNSAMGCTIVLNKEAHMLLKNLPMTYSVMHDWFILICIQSVGEVIFDTSPNMIYRIHEEQSIGLGRKMGLRKRLSLESTQLNIMQLLQIRILLGDRIRPEKVGFYDFIIELLATNWVRRLFLLLKFDGRYRDQFAAEIIFRVKIFFTLMKKKEDFQKLLFP